MMIIEKDTIKCEAIFSDDKQHRLYWERTWDKEKPKAAIITIHPNNSNNVICDTTTYLSVNNIARLGNYGGIIMVNLYSKLTSKLDFKHSLPAELNHEDNNKYILKAASEADVVILAYGRGIAGNKQMSERAIEVINLLKDHRNKIRLISDGQKEGVHPLQPAARGHWELVDFREKMGD